MQDVSVGIGRKRREAELVVDVGDGGKEGPDVHFWALRERTVLGVQLRGMVVTGAAHGLGLGAVVCETKVSQLESAAPVWPGPVQDIVRLDVAVAHIVEGQVVQSREHLLEHRSAQLVVG
jgi:hypothetical protein